MLDHGKAVNAPTRYQELKEKTLLAATAVLIRGHRVAEAVRGRIGIEYCLCVTDSPDNPCPCGPIIWVPEDFVIETGIVRAATGTKSAVEWFRIRSDAVAVIEKHVAVPMSAIGQVTSSGQGSTPRFVKAQAGPPNGFRAPVGPVNFATVLVVGAGTAGYWVGTKIDDSTGGGISDAGAENLNDWFGPAPGWLQDLF